MNAEELELATRQGVNTAKWQIDFICQPEHLQLLEKLRSGAKMVTAANDFRRMLENNQKLTPNQLNYIDGMYEKVMSQLGHGGVSLHVDKKRKGLRYPK